MRRFSIPKMAVSLPLAILAVCALIGITETGYQRSMQALDSIEESQLTRAGVNKLLQQMLDAETGQRGYLLTGDEQYLQPYDTATAQINQSLDELRTLYTPYPAERQEFGKLSRSVSRKLSEMDVSVRLRKQGNEDAWKFVLTTEVGKEQMDLIREHATQLLGSSAGRMNLSQAQVTNSLQLSRLGIAGVSLAALLAFYLYLRQTTALASAAAQQQRALEKERDGLEQLVRERTASLAELATHLQQVREQERSHLARELHDELGALLTAAKLDVARLKSRLGGAHDADERLLHLTETLNSGIALKRRIIEDLHPSSLSNLGLVASLEILTREFAERSGLEVTTDLEVVVVDEPTQLTIYRLVQESLTNVAKYAEAREVEVVLANYENHINVSVRDDGRGFDTANIDSASHGLAGMRHRVEASGGRLSITSANGQGTTVSALLPK